MKKIVLFAIIFGGFLVRLYHFDSPIADWHSWRQADTSSVSREYARNGIDLLHPRYHDLSNVASGKDNPMGYRFVEFPLYNSMQAVGFMLVPQLTLEQWGRFISIIASLISVYALFVLISKYINETAGIFAAFFYAFLPFSIYYSRTILPDVSMVCAVLLAIVFFDKYVATTQNESSARRKNYGFFFSALFFTCIALLLKPYAIFFLIPIGYIAVVGYKKRVVMIWQLWLFAVLSVIPLIAWRVWMGQFPEGIPANAWLLNGNEIRFKGSFFYWIFADRISRLILGYFGIVLVVLGLLKKQEQKGYGLVLSFVIATLSYLFIFATGNVQHDYYQILILPTLCMLMGIGAQVLWSKNHQFFVFPASLFALGVIIVCSLSFSWYYVRDYYNINNPSLVEAGDVVDRSIPKDAKIIALYNGDTSFLYQTKRSGWASLQDPLPILIEKGAQYLVVVNPTKSDFEGFGQMFPIIAQSSSYLLVKLQ